MRTKTYPLFLLLVCLGLMVAGCAARSPRVFARCGPHSLPNDAKRVALLKQERPSPEDASLENVLAAELQARGFQIVSQEQAQFTLACRMEVNTYGYTRTVQDHPISFASPNMVVVPPGNSHFHHTQPSFETRSWIEDTVEVRGIRLQAFPASVLSAGRFETAWDGCIEAGLKLPRERQAALVHALFDHFGRDFTGEVELTPRE